MSCATQKSLENIWVFQGSLGTNCDKVMSRNNVHIVRSPFQVEFIQFLKIEETHPI